jgi:hypothetical protein
MSHWHHRSIYHAALIDLPPHSFSCLGSSIPQLFDPNIWRPPWYKLENDPDDATEKNQPTSAPRQRLTPSLQSKPTPTLSYPILRPKPSTHSMCAQESSLHTYRTEHGYRIINVSIKNIHYTNNVLHKTKSETLEDIVTEWLYNSTGNRPRIIARLELLIEESQIFISFWVAW